MARPPLQTLSETHRRIAESVAVFEAQNRPAFLPDLARVLNLAQQSSLTRSLQVMVRNGYLRLHGKPEGRQRRAQVAQLTAKARHALGIGGLPLLGHIPAGLVSEAVSQAEEIVEPEALLPWRQGDFLLRVRGDSMIGDGILNGDLVLLRPQVEVPHGAIAAACVGDEREATLKRVFFEKDQVRLRASNPVYPDVVVPAAVISFAGLFKGLIRHATHSP
ncbi:MAG TPA: S24 family peptidase [Verrucomicrobiales bacterium]|nr:S24 family peptidase [Verrucomicrobiales bacterium]